MPALPERGTRANAGQWRAGVSGNPLGRPVGAKGRFSEALVTDFAREWREHGASVIATVRQRDPVAFLQIAIKLVPREFLVQLEARSAEHTERLTDEELAKILRNIRGAIALVEALRPILAKIAATPEAAALAAEAEQIIGEFLASEEHASEVVEVLEPMHEVEQLRQEAWKDRHRREAER